MSRSHGLRRVAGMYAVMETRGVCVYCGDRATTRDHVLPVTIASRLADLRAIKGGLLIVPACSDCNGLAGGLLFKSVSAKRRYIRRRLLQRHKRLLEMAEWTDQQLEACGWVLRTKILADLAAREKVRARIAWKNTANIDPVRSAARNSTRGGIGSVSARQDAVPLIIKPNAPKPSAHIDFLDPVTAKSGRTMRLEPQTLAVRMRRWPKARLADLNG